jgi:predicted RNA binding protein YcfA (HicA-like mRNA interferase family)
MKKMIAFEALRELLLNLGFIETLVPNSHYLFEHPDSGVKFLLRLYRPSDLVTEGNLYDVRHHLDMANLLEPSAFEDWFRHAAV